MSRPFIAPPPDPYRARRRRHGAPARCAGRPAVPLGRPAQHRRARTSAVARRRQAEDLADDFNRELTRAFFWLQVGPELRRDAAARRGRRPLRALVRGGAASRAGQDDLPPDRADDREGRLAGRAVRARPGPPRCRSTGRPSSARSASASAAGARARPHAGGPQRCACRRPGPTCRRSLIPRHRAVEGPAPAGARPAMGGRPPATPSPCSTRRISRRICCRSSSNATSRLSQDPSVYVGIYRRGASPSPRRRTRRRRRCAARRTSPTTTCSRSASASSGASSPFDGPTARRRRRRGASRRTAAPAATPGTDRRPGGPAS